MSKLTLYRNPCKRVQLNIIGAGTTVAIPALAGSSVQVYGMVINSSAAVTLDFQDTSGATLGGGPWSIGTPGPTGNLDSFPFTGVSKMVTGTGLGLQLVASGGTIRGWIDYMQQIDIAQPAGT